MLESGIVLNCFAMERKHRSIKRIAEFSFTSNPETHITRRHLCDVLKSLQAPNSFVQTYTPKEAPAPNITPQWFQDITMAKVLRTVVGCKMSPTSTTNYRACIQPYTKLLAHTWVP
eukprot:12294550-Karenia_brevis.AAC.1